VGEGIVPRIDNFAGGGMQQMIDVGTPPPAPLQWRMASRALVADAIPIPVGQPMEFYGVVDQVEANFSVTRLPDGVSPSSGHTALPVSVSAIEGRTDMVSVRFRVFGEGYCDIRMRNSDARGMGMNLDGLATDGTPMSLLLQQRSLYAVDVTARSATSSVELVSDPAMPNDMPPPTMENASGEPTHLTYATNPQTGDRFAVLQDGTAGVVIPRDNAYARMLYASAVPEAETYVYENGEWRHVDPGTQRALLYAEKGAFFMLQSPSGETRVYQLTPDGNSTISVPMDAVPRSH
jgi:hypothetical protein